MAYFWVPKHRYQLVDLLSRRFPSDKRIKRMKKRQLYAILYNSSSGSVNVPIKTEGPKTSV